MLIDKEETHLISDSEKKWAFTFKDGSCTSDMIMTFSSKDEALITMQTHMINYMGFDYDGLSFDDLQFAYGEIVEAVKNSEENGSDIELKSELSMLVFDTLCLNESECIDAFRVSPEIVCIFNSKHKTLLEWSVTDA